MILFSFSTHPDRQVCQSNQSIPENRLPTHEKVHRSLSALLMALSHALTTRRACQKFLTGREKTGRCRTLKEKRAYTPSFPFSM
jgi:hypothetical protein